MKEKKIILILFVSSIIFVSGSYMVAGDGLGFCTKGEIEYRDCVTLVSNISEPIFWAFLPLLIIISILFFVRREVFLAWAKFAGIFSPFMIGILLYTYNNTPTQDGFGLAGLIPDEMLASIFLPPFFFLISLLIIGIKSWKLRGRKK